jgi:hypothetical protein
LREKKSLSVKSPDSESGWFKSTMALRRVKPSQTQSNLNAQPGSDISPGRPALAPSSRRPPPRQFQLISLVFTWFQIISLPAP